MKAYSVAELRKAIILVLLTLIAGSATHGQDRTQTTKPADYTSPPSCRHCPSPDFTDEAKKAKINSASVLLDATISAEGGVDDIQVMKDPGFGLGETAVQTVRKWKFKPAKGKDGKPLAVRINIEVIFRR